MRLRHLLSISTLGTVLLSSFVARADDAANTATARALGSEGVVLAEAGRCAEAIPKLERAEKLHAAPTTATRLAECEIETGKLVAGTERLQRVIREPLAANAHPAFLAAQTRARGVLERTLPRIPTIRVTVQAPAHARYAITIDGEPAPDAIVDTDRRIDPGTHEIAVTAPGYLPHRVSATVEERESKPVVLELKPDPNAKAIALRPSGSSDAPKAPSRGPAILAFSLGGLGLAAGLVGGLNVATKSTALERGCDQERVCPPERQSDIRDAKIWATVSTIGFATAGVGLVTGVVLLITGKSESPTTRAQKPGVRPNVGLGSIGLDGAF